MYDEIKTIVYIYCQNRSFNNLFGTFPGANGLANASKTSIIQLDRDGKTPLKTLPPIWSAKLNTNPLNNTQLEGLTLAVSPQIPQPIGWPKITVADTFGKPNNYFYLDDPSGYNLTTNGATRDMFHRFYQNQMQINNGANNQFVAWADSGGLVMGVWDGSKLPLWDIAKKYTLCDNFFQGAFGGSYLNHQYIYCATVPYYPNASIRVPDLISVVNSDNTTLTLTNDTQNKSALLGPPIYINDNSLTPDGFCVNTMQPPYHPSDNLYNRSHIKYAQYANPSNHTTQPPIPQGTPDTPIYTHNVPKDFNGAIYSFGDLLNDNNISWAFWSGGLDKALNNVRLGIKPSLTKDIYQTHHQALNFYANMAPGTANREEHFKDTGDNDINFINAVKTGTLPQFSYFIPTGNFNMHAGYADIYSGNKYVADLITALEQSPQWSNMLVVITWDENGGIWDHVSPPKGDRWGPGTRIPALIISPFAKSGYVDHTQYDSASLLRFVINKFNLTPLKGITLRDESLKQNGFVPMGDLSDSLNLPSLYLNKNIKIIIWCILLIAICVIMYKKIKKV
jgi:acid phosphatase